MERAFEKRWSDFSGRYDTRPCHICNKQSLNFGEYKRDNIAGTDVVAVTCMNCGHIELFDVAIVSKVADEIDEEYHRNGWR